MEGYFNLQQCVTKTFQVLKYEEQQNRACSIGYEVQYFIWNVFESHNISNI